MAAQKAGRACGNLRTYRRCRLRDTNTRTARELASMAAASCATRVSGSASAGVRVQHQHYPRNRTGLGGAAHAGRASGSNRRAGVVVAATASEVRMLLRGDRLEESDKKRTSLYVGRH